MSKLQPYPQYKDSGVEWLGAVPEGWEIKKLKNLTTFINRGTPPNYVEKSDTVVVNQATFSKGYWNDSDYRFHDSEGSERGILREGDILLASTGGGVLGKTWFYEGTEQRAMADSHVTILRTESRFYSRYLYYFLDINFDLINGKLSQGATNQIELQKGWLKNFEFLLPTSQETQEIVNFLDVETDKIDKLICRLQQQIQLLQEYRQKIITQAVTCGLDAEGNLRKKPEQLPAEGWKDSGVEWLGAVPEGWKVRKLKYVVSKIDRQVEDSKNHKLRIAMEDVESWTAKINKSSQREMFSSKVNQFEQKDVLFGKLRPYLAKAFIAEKSGVAVGEFLVLRSSDIINSRYLLRCLLSKRFIETVNSSTYGAKMPRASWDFIGDLLIPLPSMPEQQKISGFLDQESKKIENLISKFKQQIQLLQEKKQVLVSNLVTGKVKPEDKI